MTLRLSRLAANDLKEIGDYIARENPARAVSFIRELRAVMDRIGSQRIVDSNPVNRNLLGRLEVFDQGFDLSIRDRVFRGFYR
ncbi:MAG: type II toxin-antitoxin system RelE/ParE family toxin [Burkholderiaceae bacterium]